MDTYREYVRAGVFVVLAILAGLVLRAVLQTVVFAITVAYVLYRRNRPSASGSSENLRFSNHLTPRRFTLLASLVGPLL